MSIILANATDGTHTNAIGFVNESAIIEAIAGMIADCARTRVIVQTLNTDLISVLCQADPRKALRLSPGDGAQIELEASVEVPSGYWLFTVRPDVIEPTSNQDTLLMMLRGLCILHPDICTREVHDLIMQDIRSSMRSQIENMTGALRYYADPTHWNGNNLDPRVYCQANPGAQNTQPHTAAVLALRGLTVPEIVLVQGK